MEYTTVGWVSKNQDGTIPDNAPPMSADNLNHMDEGILSAHREIERVREYAESSVVKVVVDASCDKNERKYICTMPDEISQNINKYCVLVDTPEGLKLTEVDRSFILRSYGIWVTEARGYLYSNGEFYINASNDYSFSGKVTFIFLPSKTISPKIEV